VAQASRLRFAIYVSIVRVEAANRDVVGRRAHRHSHAGGNTSPECIETKRSLTVSLPNCASFFMDPATKYLAKAGKRPDLSALCTIVSMS
jgi:hypothetical protein